jgi:hypothetical protein
MMLPFLPVNEHALLPLRSLMVLPFVPVEELALLAIPLCGDIAFLSLKIYRNVSFVKGHIAAISVAIGTTRAGIIDSRHRKDSVATEMS